ncbi:hypothetical protein NQ314_011698 [Rhamnusium bicolor]|uniref:DUF4806 domain-containing protein n=1 Tax=Rhamnusium bicolor TaxID=1586634 RepID=A0AAV8XFV8_9CUCU|nr:hypothetical protein NQ314_011698 [Rhamnusium bicolor]
MTYVIVEFHEQYGGGVAAIHSSWFTPLKKEAFWPPYKEQQRFDKALRFGEVADENSWKLYGIARIFYETDDILKVRQKLKDAEVTSNLESEQEDINNNGRQKRKHKIVRKLYSSDDECSEQESLPRPPPIKKDLFSFQSFVTGWKGTSDQLTVTDKLIALVSHVKEQNDQILTWIAKQNQKSINNTEFGIPDIPFSFPVQTIEELDELNAYVNDNNDKFTALASYLATLGGNTLTSKTNRIFKHVISDVVTIKFNYYGQRSKKRAFSDLAVKNLILGAVKRGVPNSTDKDIEDVMKVWLKHARERLKKKDAGKNQPFQYNKLDIKNNENHELFSPQADFSRHTETSVPSNIFVANSESKNLLQVNTEPCLRSSLRQWSVNLNVSHAAVTGLLHVLHPFHTYLPLSSKALLKTPRQTDIKQIGDGEFYYFGLKASIKSNLSACNQEIKGDKIEISFNIDGIPLFNSSNQQFWPILGLIKNFRSKPFAIGIFSGRSKPKPLELYLEDFVNELSLLLQEGFKYNNKKYQIIVHSFVCDAPARAFIKCIKTHSGYSSCEKCVNPGEYIQGRIVFKNVFASKRTDAAFIIQQDEDHHIGLSPLLNLGIGMVTTFPVDYMHACCLGVMRKLISFWLSGTLSTRLCSLKVQIISKQMIALKQHIPLEFNRKPRTLGEVQRWKATEFRTFLLYLGAFVLKNTVNKAIYEHFLLFHVAISILISRKLISKFGCAYANELLLVFVQHCERLYGQQFLIYNVHMLLHLADDVNKYGPLDVFSCFPFENFLGQIKRMIGSPTNTLQQACRRLHEIQQLTCNVNVSEKTNLHFIEHSSGPLSENLITCKQFKKCLFRDSVICTHSYSPANSYCLTNKDKVMQVQNIALIQNNTFIIGNYFQSYDSLYKYPLDSKDLNIYVLTYLLPNLEICPFNEVIAKCLVLPSENGSWVSFPIIHTCEEI